MVILASLLAVIAINAALFAVAYKNQSDKLTDFSYALSFIVVAVAAFVLSDHRTTLLFITTAMVLAWALRLGIFLVIRIRKSGKDSRFNTIRRDFFKFLKFWLGQGLVAWLLLLPVLLLAQRDGELNTLAFVGMAIWAAGLAIESVADFQKYRFTHNPANKDKWIHSGLWHYSRHPNYFGEICVWVGMYVAVVSSLSGIEQLVGLVSPLAIFITLRFVSGIPPLEQFADKKWGANPDYQAYKKRTSLLVPWFVDSAQK